MKRGFTLVELLLVVACAFFLTGVSLAGLRAYRTKLFLRTAPQLSLLQLRAVQGRAISIAANQSSGGDSFVFPGIVRKIPKTFIFSRNGMAPPGGSGTLVFSDGQGERKVVVSNWGRIRIE
jgi:type II secretory pathway pseudopilin PulG